MKTHLKTSLSVFAFIFVFVFGLMPALAAPSEADIALGKEVSKAIMNYNDVKASAYNGVVTLSGMVATEYDVSNVGKLAEKVPGVKSVVNNVKPDTKIQRQVTEIQAKDQKITREVAYSLAGQSALDGSSIHVNTVQGVVRLTGKVDNADQSAMAAKIAAGVKGVKTVDNQLQVVPGYISGNSDRAINMRVQRALAQYQYIDVQPTTAKRVVTLNGVVPTSKDRDNVASLVSKVEGVKSVDNRIVVQEQLSDAQISDVEITRQVRAAIEADPYIDPINTITISTADGVVTLHGAVSVPDNVKQAAQDAALVPGVKEVKNNLEFEDM